MNREERMQKIEAECKYTTERTSHLHFLLSEVKRLEESARLFEKHFTFEKELNTHLSSVNEAIQKENAELRERHEKNFLLATNSLTELQSKLDVVRENFPAIKYGLERLGRSSDLDGDVRDNAKHALEALASLGVTPGNIKNDVEEGT